MFWGERGNHLKPQVKQELILTAKRLLLSIGLLVDQCKSFSKREKEGRGGEVERPAVKCGAVLLEKCMKVNG